MEQIIIIPAETTRWCGDRLGSRRYLLRRIRLAGTLGRRGVRAPAARWSSQHRAAVAQHSHLLLILLLVQYPCALPDAGRTRKQRQRQRSAAACSSGAQSECWTQSWVWNRRARREGSSAELGKAQWGRAWSCMLAWPAEVVLLLILISNSNNKDYLIRNLPCLEALEELKKHLNKPSR